MKKRFFGFIIVFVVFFTGVMCLSSCGGGGPTLSKIFVEVNNTEYETYNFGDFEYGTQPNLAYKVYAKYSDDTKKDLTSSEYSTEYQFNNGVIDSLPTTYNVGSYSIRISYKESELMLYFNIIAATKTYQTVLIPQKTQWSYGEAQPELKINDDTIELNSSAYKYIEKSKVADPKNLTTKELDSAEVYNNDIALEPGEYYLFVVVPENGNYKESISSLKAVTVNKINLVVDTDASTLKSTYIYGSSNPGNVTVKDLEKPYVVFKTEKGEPFDFVEMNFAEPNKELNSTDNGKTIKLNFTLTEEYNKRYNAPDPVDILLEIQKATFDKPSIGNVEDKVYIYVDELGSSTWYGDWRACTLTATKPDGTTQTMNIDSEEGTHILLDKPTIVGKYTYTISLKDKVNFAWKDGTTEALSLEWEIKEIKMEDLKWRVGNSEVTNGQSFVSDSLNPVSPPEIILPEGVNWDINGYKYYKADGTELSAYPVEFGSYYATFDKNCVVPINGHYIVTGELARLDYSIIAGDDVTGKAAKFTGMRILKADGTEPSPEEFEGLAELMVMTEAISSSNIENNATTKCEVNGTVSGTCDFGSGTFNQLIEAGTPYKYTYSSKRENTVEIFIEDEGGVIEETKLVGNFINGTLTLTMNIPSETSTGLIWQFTFELIETTEA